MCVCVFTCKFLLEVVRVLFLQIFIKRIKSAYSLKSKFLQIFTGKVNEQTYLLAASAKIPLPSKFGRQLSCKLFE